jgi:hypothetical protein
MRSRLTVKAPLRIGALSTVTKISSQQGKKCMVSKRPICYGPAP